MKQLTEERIKEILHILRNPWGKSDEQMMKARHDAADYIESGLTPRAADVANVTAFSVSCPRCGLTWSEFPEDICVCDPNSTPYIVGSNKCSCCGKPRG